MSTSVPGRLEEDLPGSGAGTSRRVPRPAAGRKRRGGGRRNPRMRGPIRTLTALLVLTIALFAGVGAAHLWGTPKGSLTPQLGLDLAGGRQVVLAPRTEAGQSVSPEQLDQAIDIIRRRVDSTGTSEAEVSRLGSNVSVAIPGNPTPAQLEALSRSSQMVFRPVLVATPVLPAGSDPLTPRELPLPSEQLKEQVEQLSPPTTVESDGSGDSGSSGSGDDAQQTDENRGGERLPTSSQDQAATTATTDDASQTTEAPAPPATNPSDLTQITSEIQQQFMEADCAANATEIADAAAAAPADQPLVVCSSEGDEKYILGPVELSGSNLEDATAGIQQLSQGVVSGIWEVVLTFDDEGSKAFAATTSRLMGYQPGAAQNRFAMVLDGEVISAPTVNNVISNGIATISGNFTPETAQTLADQLKFGALPLSFEVQTSEQISPTLGGEQLRWGLIAGLIGMVLVFAFMLVQYHALGLVAIGSLLVAALLTYGAVTLLGWATNFRLTMAGVTGLIVAIGVTADSFIVYFERVRDEVRAGRPLRYAVDTGWDRARRTIIISDVVNLIAAAVLYALSESGVKAFAFTLGLTTVLDLVIVIMFTHPLVSILANTSFFGEGRKWSGMEPERLGAKRSTYLGRGQFREPDVVAPGRRRHTREELEGGVV
ncbi:protein translocase subunit SecD [Ornithinimicrobium tianjinense]|uniref:Protein translocase subunit SecD n=1 Tax=Ornithinimicrobium tianjinense TaxID=1195761 RepID=A0A917BKI9_9MICO|nr:protein translocase subunit SecD [Ornithinimicrobium tianjinense]GGF46817.1 protein translocase subunit SecD [Ornithinimicrobium tianjinense]